MTSLESLERAAENLSDFEYQHRQVFEAWQELKEALEVAEDAVRTEAKQRQANMESLHYRVVYTPAKTRWFDVETVRKVVDADLVAATELIYYTESVDEKTLKSLVKLGKIPESLLKEAYREQTTSHRVTIERKDT